MPEDVPLIYAGMRLDSGEWMWIPTLLAAVLGVFIRDMAAFGVGRRLGEHALVGHRVATWVGVEKIERSKRLFDRYDVGAIFFGRLFIGFRTPIFMVAGALGVPTRRFAVWNFAGLVVTVPLMIIVGYVIGEPIAELVLHLSKRGREVGVFLILAVGAWLLWTRHKKVDEPKS